MEIKTNNPQLLLEKVKPIILEKQKNVERATFRFHIIDLIDKKDFAGACFQISSYLMRKYHFTTFSDTNEIYVYIEGVRLPRGEEIIMAKIQNILEDYCKIHLVNEILGHIKRSTIVYRGLIKEESNKLCLENGILNLETMKIEAHSPEFYFFNKLPVVYIPTAGCPLIKKFLSEIVGSEEIKLIQEFVGYCLYKDYFIHKSFILVGSGANGKSTLLNLLKALLGVDNVASIPLQSLESNRFAISSLQGKLANIFADLSSRALSGTSMFKMLVGQDSVPAERKFKGQFFFVNYAKFIFSANQIPKTPEDTDGFFRRWIIINFPNQFLKKADKHLIKKLATSDELSGFLNFAIEGLKRLLEQGDFSATKSIEETRDQYIRMSDSVGAFDMDMVLTSLDDYIAKKTLYTAYCDYCRNKGYPIMALNTFHRELQAKRRVEDYRPSLDVDGKKERVQCWKGIKLNDVELKCESKPDNTDRSDQDVYDVNNVNDKTPINSQELDKKVNEVNDVKVNSQLVSTNDDSDSKIEVIKIK